MFNDHTNIIETDIEKMMKESFLQYSMSVICSRALPDVRDGLKPVHRRILYTMYENGLYPEKPYRKCADTVGSVLGKYHPHGDASVYDALVRMAQTFSLRYPMIDGQGNFGSIDGDPPAAYRYTEAKMAKISMNMLTDIGKETVDYQSNYDDRLKEPVVLPSRFPQLLCNGSVGIAVGMATNIPPHNLGEVIDAMKLMVRDPDCTLDELKKQNEELTSKVAELSEAQKTAERLEGLVGLQSTYNLKSTAARIVGASGDAWTSTVTIDKGSADGLTINMPVTSSAGVIGQIIEVSAKTSTVRLIGDENSGVSAMVQDTRAQGMLQGQADGTLRLEYVSVDSDVKVGDIIVTSGIGGVFPKGLPLGTVSSVEKSANDVYYTIVVRAQTTAENNEEVLVITSLTDEQSASDEDVNTANSTPQGTSRDAATKTKDESPDDSSDTSETTDSGSSE